MGDLHAKNGAPSPAGLKIKERNISTQFFRHRTIEF